MAKVHMLTYEALLEEEDTQVFGFTHFGDFRTMSTAHVMLWSPTVFATIFKWGEVTLSSYFPIIKCYILYNIIVALDY